MIPVIQFQAWVPVLVERAERHPIAIYSESVILRGLACRDARSDGVEVYCPMSISPRPVLICVFPYMINPYMYCARRGAGQGQTAQKEALIGQNFLLRIYGISTVGAPRRGKLEYVKQVFQRSKEAAPAVPATRSVSPPLMPFF